MSIKLPKVGVDGSRFEVATEIVTFTAVGTVKVIGTLFKGIGAFTKALFCGDSSEEESTEETPVEESEEEPTEETPVEESEEEDSE